MDDRFLPAHILLDALVLHGRTLLGRCVGLLRRFFEREALAGWSGESDANSGNNAEAELHLDLVVRSG
jgi:hypothetical protein